MNAILKFPHQCDARVFHSSKLQPKRIFCDYRLTLHIAKVSSFLYKLWRSGVCVCAESLANRLALVCLRCAFISSNTKPRPKLHTVG